MNWATFWASVGSFFSDVGSVFLSNIKAAIPVVEQAGLNLLTTIVDVIIADIETGVIPLPVLAVEGTDTLTLGKTKRDLAFSAVKQKLATTTIPSGVAITDHLIYLQIELSVCKMKSVGNGGNFPGGNSNG